MKNDTTLGPDYLFEVSWEVCNKIGGIHTVIATKALNMAKALENRHILIGPDVWKDSDQNPEFTEDPKLLRSWKVKAAQEGLRIRVGRWNVSGNPISILVDYSSMIAKKDEIFAGFWERYKLDSISGQWDYIEPALFGYATGKVIESFVRYHLAPHHKVIAQFHEWMTGTGLLYLKSINLPIGCVFTTHATVLGRSIAGNNLPLYDSMTRYNPDEKAREYNVMSKHSLEKAAAQTADAFTTVSDVTDRECAYFLGREVDVITPNGFENSFTPLPQELSAKRAEGREALLKLAADMLGYEVDKDAFLVGISGRYEFTNKGIDVFVDALGKLNQKRNVSRQILAFVMTPAGITGPNKVLLQRMNQPQTQHVSPCFTTHELSEKEFDPLLRRLEEQLLFNKKEDRVKVFFVSSYLNGNDGIINKHYYDLLVGLDLSVFPSYYEPWGYTPLESLAFSVPTVTTSLAGFGLWVASKYNKLHPGIDIIERNDSNSGYVVDAIMKKIEELCNVSEDEKERIRINAKEVSTIALWDHQIEYYKRAYSLALEKIMADIGSFPAQRDEGEHLLRKEAMVNAPQWSRIMIHKQLPNRLSGLETLSKNLWWCWNQSATALFQSIDPQLWQKSEGNPIQMLDNISLKRYQELEKDVDFVSRLDTVMGLFDKYMSSKEQLTGPKIAYFSMEYGLDASLKIYSGGLGILAGDYLKESSDKGVRMIGVGLLYRYGYFTQKISAQGNQVAEYEAQDFLKIPVTPVRDQEGIWATISLAFPGRTVYARLWRVDVGRTELILLDTDIEENQQEDREITYHLYGGSWENRLKQELLLGIGGIRALRLLDIEADVYHCNEGHAAFIGLERIREYVMGKGLRFDEAVEVVRASSLFTTHTPVPAGHDSFSEEMLRTYIAHYPDRMKTTWEVLMELGKVDIHNPGEKFSMSFLAANLSLYVNGVSWLHGKVSQEILAPLWPGYLPEELHVSYVTNGVHYATWTADEWKVVHDEVFGRDFAGHHYNKSCFDGIYQVPDKTILSVRNKLRAKLIARIKERMSGRIALAHYPPHDIVAIRETLRDDILTIGFARRFATYKRAHLLFKNLVRLDEIVNNPKQPIQFLFAGKAHPADKAGQDLIKRIIEVSRLPQFLGKILFLENYDMNLAKALVQGVDVWMNTPTRPLEASGTSGEKAVMNGVMHFSVLDGWWVEGYQPDAGWALPMERTYENQEFQDEMDSETIYNILEDQIAPLFYQSNAAGIPEEWVKIIKNTIAKVASNFTTNRMLTDYEDRFYTPLYQRSQVMTKDDFELARELAYWKKKMTREWINIEMVAFKRPDMVSQVLLSGKKYEAEAVFHIGVLSPEDIGVEMVIAEEEKNGKFKIVAKVECKLYAYDQSIATYRCVLIPDSAGVFHVAGRMYAKNSKLAHRQDFVLVKWL
ncbi:MAG: alpha-glucan family phosphorylase [Prevotellaceae bacterium]|nr:alpha-glucan family phosphorylase [Prevotellaceae bacterium]